MGGVGVLPLEAGSEKRGKVFDLVTGKQGGHLQVLQESGKRVESGIKVIGRRAVIHSEPFPQH